ncbi:MAG: hypothetical protein RML12_02530 [Xanthomonadales bacterium]|nr:hypothetical protein [Xanthomonadales bacterium]
MTTQSIRSLTGVALGAALLLAADGRAVDLILSTANGPCTMPLTPGSNVTIDPNTGNVLASVASGASCPQLAGNAPLTVTKTGSGAGTVTSSPPGISCGATCSAQFPAGSSVTLTASAAAGSSFAGWSGDCTGTGACTVVMSAARSVTATFDAAPTYQLTVTKAGTGTGTVSSSPSGISCGSTCTGNFNQGSTVTLTAVPDSGSSFAGWSGAGCSGTGSCVVTMSSNQSVTATFNTGTSVPGCDGVNAPAPVANRVTSTTIFVNFVPPMMTVNATSFADIFRQSSAAGGSPVPWPGQSTPRAVRIAKNGHIAAEFQVPSATTVIRWDLSFEVQGDPDGGSVPQLLPYATISRCPGNFNTSGPNAVHPNCVWPAAPGSWSMDVVASASGYTGSRCPVEKGQTYYLNLAHWNPANPGEPGCTGTSQCSIAIRSLAYQ